MRSTLSRSGDSPSTKRSWPCVRMRTLNSASRCLRFSSYEPNSVSMPSSGTVIRFISSILGPGSSRRNSFGPGRRWSPSYKTHRVCRTFRPITHLALEFSSHVRARLAARHRFLLPAAQVFDRHRLVRPLIVAFDRDERHVPARRILELLSELVGVGIDLDTQPRSSEIARQLDGRGA